MEEETLPAYSSFFSCDIICLSFGVGTDWEVSLQNLELSLVTGLFVGGHDEGLPLLSPAPVVDRPIEVKKVVEYLGSGKDASL